ncbi:ectoine/hydroxyectoine ABC transporter permease subunit EhuC [Arthrobacter castelli]|uniref:ectoine/hydroxyectoine ABC transporter permease subunit EhuC n=1 Tax=Arthrobacter castelli TaxID=271431 RepID=UPI00047C4433|nr:ectoine/hydroxyectoine ABC transporter permease subunit EhuC [Arthrobacter castelli]
MTYFQELAEALPRIMNGVWVTLGLTLGGAALAMIIAVTLGLMARQPNTLIRGIARAIIEFFRGTSLVVQLLWLYFILPGLGINLNVIFVGVMALGLNYGAYSAEVVRGSINSVQSGQWEASTALSMSRVHRMRRIIFPQAWALMIPSLTNLLIHMLKGSAVVSFITIYDLTFRVDQLRLDTGTWFAYGLVGLGSYFIIAYILTLIMNMLEVRAKHRLGRGESLREMLSLKPARPSAETGVLP